ncbi:MAG: flippase-like domain-containing protein [Deltaproteobacteria bacterium]|nr:flippase-like domain-containing protein [Deltaproteobacteria bacterium]
MKKGLSNLLRLISLIIGLGLFVVSIQKFGGFSVVLHKLGEVRGFYLWVIANSFLWMLFYTRAWQQLFRGVRPRVPFRGLLKIKLSGEGVNFMTPLGFMVGDPVRILLLRKLVGPDSRLRSVVIDRTLHSLAANVFNLVGLALLLTQPIEFPAWLHIIMVLIYIFLCTVMGSLLISMVSGKGYGVLEPFVRLLIRWKRFPQPGQKLIELREHLEFYKDRSKIPVWLAFLYHFVGRVLGGVEIMIILYCFTGRWELVFCLILIALTSFFTVVFGWIPGALGVVEALYANFSVLYGFDGEIGLSVQIVRRLRVLFWMAVGILVMDFAQVADYIKKIKAGKKIE